MICIPSPTYVINPLRTNLYQNNLSLRKARRTVSMRDPFRPLHLFLMILHLAHACALEHTAHQLLASRQLVKRIRGVLVLPS